MLFPVEQSFIETRIHFNMHLKMPQTQILSPELLQSGQFLSLYPINSLFDVAKIFFLIDEHELWNAILKSHVLYSPTDHLLESAKSSVSNFRLMDAAKSYLLYTNLQEGSLSGG